MYITSRVDHWKSCIGSIWRQTVILGRMRNDGFLSLIVPVPTSRVLAGQRGRCGNCGCLWCKPQFGHDLWPTFYTDKHFIKCICCDVGGEKLVVAINPTALLLLRLLFCGDQRTGLRKKFQNFPYRGSQMWSCRSFCF